MIVKSRVWPALVLAFCACESPAGPPRPPEPTRLNTYVPIERFGVPGASAYRSPEVIVQDQRGNAMPGVLVRFRATAGSIEFTEVVTDGRGYAAAGRWTLRSTAGEDTVFASVDGVEPLRFRARVRVPVEVAHYALESVLDIPVPVPYGTGWTATSGSLSFYADQTYVWRVVTVHDDGRIHTPIIQGTYSLGNGIVSGVEAADRFRLTFAGTPAGNRLRVHYIDNMDWWDEVYVKSRVVEPWP
jgi:hypothetical protein